VRSDMLSGQRNGLSSLTRSDWHHLFKTPDLACLCSIYEFAQAQL
jgi:hypothetical protein